MRIAGGIALAGLLLIAAPALGQGLGDILAGREYAKSVCAECHAVLPSDPWSPSIDAPTFFEIANTSGMTARALTVWLQTSHPSMPNLLVPPDDRDDLIAYILSLKDERK